MFKQYLSDPKPVVWSGIFSKKPAETNQQALARCYPELIRTRSDLYEKFADVTFVIARDNRDKFSMKQLLQLAGAK